MSACPRCDGIGTILCLACDIKKPVYPPVLANIGDSICSRCNGSGEIICSRCEGSGEIYTSDPSILASNTNKDTNGPM